MGSPLMEKKLHRNSSWLPQFPQLVCARCCESPFWCYLCLLPSVCLEASHHRNSILSGNSSRLSKDFPGPFLLRDVSCQIWWGFAIFLTLSTSSIILACCVLNKLTIEIIQTIQCCPAVFVEWVCLTRFPKHPSPVSHLLLSVYKNAPCSLLILKWFSSQCHCSWK